MQTQTSNMLKLLGPLELVMDGSQVALGGLKQRSLLAFLVLRAGEPVSIGALVAAVWGDDAPDGAVRSLRTYVSNLRRILGSTADLKGEHGAYRITLQSLDTDIDLFRQGVIEAGSADDPHEIRMILEPALELWRGPFLGDIDRFWVSEESLVLEAEHQNAASRWAEAVIADGDPGIVIPVVERLLAESPLDERLIGLLMRALYMAGRQSDALGVYRRLRTGLAEELGVEPGPELMKLEEQILLHDPSMNGAEPRWLMPAPASDMVGRSVEIEDLMARVQQVRLLTLTGPGGVGKTRLAVEVGRRIMERDDEPVFFVDLSAVRNESAVDAVLASSAGVQPHPDAGPLSGLIQYLRPRTSVLIVDNCEHLAGTVARSIAALVRGCPDLTIIATSRSPLHIDGEFEWRTPPLALPAGPDASIDVLARWPAVRLLLQRAPSSFEATDANIGDIVLLCRSLDALPLALELAASRLGSMTPAEILSALGSRLSLERVDPGDDSRHATLDATIGWSFELLGDQSRELFVRLGVMNGVFVLDDVLSVCASEERSPQRMREQLSDLVDRSLVVAETSGARTRYRLLETIRRFCLQHLGEDENPLRERHADHFAGVAEVEGSRLLTVDEGDAIVELSFARDNIRGAISWAMEDGTTDSASRIVSALPDGAYWRSWIELSGWARWVWENTTSSNPLWEAICGSAARGAWMEGHFDDAVRYGQSGATGSDGVATLSGHPGDVLADVALYQGDAATAFEHYSNVAEEASERGDIVRHVWAMYYVAITNAVVGRPVEARAAAKRTLAGARQIGNPTILAFALYANGLAVKHQMPVEATAMFEEAVGMADSVENDWFGGIARMELASVKATHDDLGTALADFAVVVDHWHRTGDDTQLRHTWRYLVRALDDAGLRDEAAILAGALLADTGSILTHPHPQVLKNLEEALGDAQYTRLTVRGSIMSVPELVSVSLDAIDEALAR